LVDVAAAAARSRASGDAECARVLAGIAVLRPEGFAYLAGPSLPGSALAAVVQAVTGTDFPPPTAAVQRLSAALRPSTLAGARVMPAGRLGPGFLLLREAAAMAPAVPAIAGTVWDRRFRLAETARPPPVTTIGALGANAAQLRDRSDLPAAVLRTLPVLRSGDRLVAVPHLDYPDPQTCADIPILFCPVRPASPAPYFTG
ncbi:MAG: tRNA lysidine(34) synthetase TilS, partial [Acetobacteraceae bacterium]